MTTALYRRYRPETFAEVIGQEHVTAPLMQALRSGRVNHAYLFSGPRGCGKTTSARILARTLNCARNTPETPIDTPCGECDSCVELARGGPGSLDVVEIDAASHNGVDDARDLRERATFAPARDRYKIFILDEAHMVTPQGFNALLKIVEEPPPHVKFVFATTEPDKVIGTIRSRTHHYPFRLVPPDVLGPYLEQLTAAEGIELGGGVVPLVTRAGGGSVRDSLSVLDQLIAGATGGVVEYDTAVGLLGFTHATLLDDVVDALAARDGASIFRVVDQVIATGHEPRRFVEDVLERLRDLIVIAVSGDAAEAVLRGLPADQLERMRTQAGRLGVSELSRAADLVNAALTEMTGATSPRLHLELLCARLLLPGADDGTEGLAARIDRLERGVITGGGAPAQAAAPVDGAPVPASAPVSSSAAAPSGGPSGGLSGAAVARAALQASRRPASEPVGSTEPAVSEPVGSTEPAVSEPAPAPPAPEPVAEPTAAADPTAGPSAPVPDVETVVSQPALTVRPEPEPGPESSEPESAEPEPEPEPAEPEPEDDGPVDDFPVDGPDDAEPADLGPAGASDIDSTPLETAPAPPAPAPVAAPAAGGGAEATAEMVRRRWDEVVANIGSPVTRALVGPNAQVVSLEGGLLRLGFAAAGMARTFSQPRHVDAVSESVYQTLGVQVRVEATLDEGRSGGGTSPSGSTPPSGGDQGGPPSPTPSNGASPTAPQTTTPLDRAAPSAPSDDRPAGGTGAGPTPPPGPAAGSSAPTPVATVSAATAPPAGPRASAAVSRPSGGVALAERPPAPERSAAEDADAAWLAGASTAAAPPEPARPDPASVGGPTRAPAGPQADVPPPWAQEPEPAAPPGEPATPPSTPGPTAGPSVPVAGAPAGPAVRETPRQAAERRVREAEQTKDRSSWASSGPGAVDDEPSADDPDITSAGLVGVQLVVQVLDGKVIEEIAEQP
ncbi:DNA polymerase III subunit gamma and tau [Krasilnikoviella flava]|uniref:DNA-directed DNA polymerase n=1 Tax=Krasilnikoviella flava TaxID=526729 RepID=A0A1T5IP95_9MICO|nr:DNA polymerase III subunit gamma and tau [Krasilnikoviella flava]SKC40965.1 DNA polymerase-3 subunit gamma/tau [Krasilnikoviella flava]